MNPSHDFGVWVAALLTLFVFSFLYKDNPLYKFAEHLFVGVSAGYYIVLNYWTVIESNLIGPLRVAFGGAAGGPMHVQQGDYRALLLIPGLLGLLLFARLFPRIDWISRWPLAVIIGVYAGLKTTGFAQGDLVAQAQASLQSFGLAELAHAFKASELAHTSSATWQAIGHSFDIILFTVGLLTSLLYFYYSREHKGALGVSSRLGIWFLMVSFGAAYGYTVMSRISLLIGRFQFLIEDWLRIH
jgi:hypothetical protein